MIKLMQKGFVFLPMLIVVVFLVVGGVVYFGKSLIKSESSVPQPTPIVDEPTASPSATKAASPSIPSSKQTSPTVSKGSKTSPTPSPTTATQQGLSVINPADSYDLTGPTGAVRVDIVPKAGVLIGDQIVELMAKSGYKVLDGKSTDKLTAIVRQGRPEGSFSTVPPGPYKVRVRYKDQWSSEYDVKVESAKQSIIVVEVSGDPAPTLTPTPTPKPKPVCSVLMMPSSTGAAPFQSSVCIGNNSNPYQGVQQEFADYDGDGNWDYQGQSYGCHAYTFQNPGTYTPKGKIIGVSGDESEVCQTTVTINP